MIEMALGSSLTYSRSSIVGSLHCAAILWGRSKMDEQLMTKYFLALKNKLGLRLRSWRRTDPDFSSLHEGPTGKIRMSKLYGQEEPLYKVQSQKNRTPKYEQSWNEKEKVGGTLEAALVHILTYTNAEQWKTWADEAIEDPNSNNDREVVGIIRVYLRTVYAINNSYHKFNQTLNEVVQGLEGLLQAVAAGEAKIASSQNPEELRKLLTENRKAIAMIRQFIYGPVITQEKIQSLEKKKDSLKLERFDFMKTTRSSIE